MKEKLLDILEKIPYYLDDFFCFCPIASVAQSLCRHFEKQPYGRSGIPDHICRLSYFLPCYAGAYHRNPPSESGHCLHPRRLNTFGLDIAYEKISFSSSFTRPLMTADDFRLYSLNGNWSLTIPRLRLYASISITPT